MGWEFLQYIASTAKTDTEGDLASLSIRAVGIASIAIIALLSYSALQKRMKNTKKKFLFLSITSLILATTILLFSTTIYLNNISDSKGPVHWHTDIEFWVCGTEVELRDPTGFLSNKIGTATYHEHDDKRIHLEGVVVEKEYDASLRKFMDVTNGRITDQGIVVPTQAGLIEDDADGDVSLNDVNELQKYSRDLESGTVLELNNGDSCYGQPSEVQAFLFRYNTEDDTYTQTKLEDPASYIMRDESIVPPGDCLIVEFAPSKESTDKICMQYGVRDVERCEQFSGGKRNDKLCKVRQIKGASQ